MSAKRLPRGVVVAVAILLALPLGAVAHERELGRAPALGAPPPGLVPAVVGLDFGEILVGTTSAGEDYVYTNGTAGDVTVTVSISGPNVADFVIAANTCSGAPIAAAGTCTVTVTFTPGGEYARTATLQLADGQPTPPAIPLSGVGLLPESGVAWGATTVIGSAYTWTQGTALARSVAGSTQYLHALIQRYDVPKQGIFYKRSTNGGATWLIGARLSPTTQVAARSTVAAAGGYVYAAWSSLAGASPSGTQPRVLFFRSNRTYGSGTWSSIRRLTSATGRIDYPRLAAYGSVVYLTYTDAATGAVKIQVSRDRGATWRVVTLGTTSRSNSYGKIGAPVVAAYGSTVAVAWVSSAAGSVRFRSSSNYGSTWGTTTYLGGGAEIGSGPSIAAYGSRIAVGWTGSTAMSVRVRSGTAWSPVRSIRPSAGSLHEYAWPWIGQVALASSTKVGIAWEACWAGCDAGDPEASYRSDLLWRESADNGATWARSQVIGEAPIGDYESFYFPSVVWPAASTRYVMAGRWYGPNLLDNVMFRAGAGTP